MRKWMGSLLCLALMLSLAGCAGSRTGGKTGNQPAGVNDVLEAGMEEAGRKETENESLPEETENGSLPEETEELQAAQEPQSAAVQETGLPEETLTEPEAHTDAAVKAEEDPDDIDVDLTTLSSTMVYSEVFNMMNSPQDYIGKTVKMKGSFAYYHDEATDNYYFACIVQDAAACCAQGIEFVLTEDYRYPEDYPEVDEEICTVGVFDTYKEGEFTYCTLRNARLLS